MLNPISMGHEIIKKIREERDWTLQELANRLDSYPQQISKYELGQTELTLEWIVKFSRVFGVSPLVFFQEYYEKSVPNLNKYAQTLAKFLLVLPIKGAAKALDKQLDEERVRLIAVLVAEDMAEGRDIDPARYQRAWENAQQMKDI